MQIRLRLEPRLPLNGLTAPRKVAQLFSFLSEADQFRALLSMGLKAELQAGKMKIVKPFSKTCYSENVVLDSSPFTNFTDKEREDGSLIDSGKKAGEGDAPVFHGGLGLSSSFQETQSSTVLRGTPVPGHRTHTAQGFERRPR